MLVFELSEPMGACRGHGAVGRTRLYIVKFEMKAQHLIQHAAKLLRRANIEAPASIAVNLVFDHLQTLVQLIGQLA